jgi:hypothetical protein
VYLFIQCLYGVKKHLKGHAPEQRAREHSKYPLLSRMQAPASIQAR